MKEMAWIPGHMGTGPGKSFGVSEPTALHQMEYATSQSRQTPALKNFNQ